MSKRLFVGSLPFTTTSDDLGQLFAKAGQVISAVVITDRMSGKSKGFGFVELSTDEEADKAIKELNGQEIDGRKIVVAEAKPREDRPQDNRR